MKYTDGLQAGHQSAAHKSNLSLITNRMLCPKRNSIVQQHVCVAAPGKAVRHRFIGRSWWCWEAWCRTVSNSEGACLVVVQGHVHLVLVIESDTSCSGYRTLWAAVRKEVCVSPDSP